MFIPTVLLESHIDILWESDDMLNLEPQLD